MSNCSCTPCNGNCNTQQGTCPPNSCSVEALDGRDDSCQSVSLAPKKSSLVYSNGTGFKAADGSDLDKINLGEVRKIMAGLSVLATDTEGNLGRIEGADNLEGYFLGILNGKLQLLKISENLLSYNASSVSSSRDGTLAMWACGPNGTLMLKQLDLKDCLLGTNAEGKVICRDPKVCLKETSDDITESAYIVALNSDGCLARIPVPSTSGKCYDLVIESGKIKVIEKRETKYFVPSGGVEIVNATPAATTTATVDLTSRIPAGKCFSTAQVIVRASIVAASRANASSNVKVAGYTVGELACTWYQVSSCNVVIDIPLGVDNTFSWEMTIAGSLREAAKIKIHLVSFS